jgi:hypothetical protein
MTSQKTPKIVFAPGCFDHMGDITQEELDNLVAAIQESAANGTLLDEATLMSDEDIDDLPPEVLAQIMDPDFVRKLQ